MLAQLFADIGFAYPTIRERDGISCILSFNFSELNSIETNLYEIVTELQGDVIECKYDDVSFQCAVKFKQQKHGLEFGPYMQGFSNRARIYDFFFCVGM